MQRSLIFWLTLLLSGRAMTLAFISHAGGGQPGDPPAAWLMPLIGDAVIGLTGLVVAYLVARRTGTWVWTTVIVWNSVAIWDALSAFIVHLTNPWPEFFMIRLFGPSMFFLASAMHMTALYLASQRPVRSHFLSKET